MTTDKPKNPAALSAALAASGTRFYEPPHAAAPAGSAFFAAREAEVTGQSYQPSPEEVQRRSRRNVAIALGIVAFIVLVYAITMLRITQNLPGAGG